MKGSASRMGLALAMVCLLCLVRPASAQTAAQFDATRLLITTAVDQGNFKCFSTSIALVNYLNIAQASSGARRIQALTFARDCACLVSREGSRLTSFQPFFTLGAGIPDLALGFHTVVSQTAIRGVCNSVQALLDIASPPATGVSVDDPQDEGSDPSDDPGDESSD